MKINQFLWDIQSNEKYETFTYGNNIVTLLTENDYVIKYLTE